MAEIGWIDFSRQARNRVNTVLELMKPEGQVDELGIGTLRDGLADSLFPGISTIQTRAKYFFIIPYILWDYQKLSPSERKKKKPTDYLEEQEYEVMWDLAEAYEHQEGNGVIGITKKRASREKISRRPSDIYWNGLRIMRFIDAGDESANSFLNRASRNRSQELEGVTPEEGSKDDPDAAHVEYFKLNIEYVPGWRDGLRLDLSNSEASRLKHSMEDLEESVLALLMKDDDTYQVFSNSSSFVDFVRGIYRDVKSAQLKKTMVIAHDFAILMQGAYLAYNQEIQLKFYGADPFKDKWDQWHRGLRNTMIDLNGFNPDDLFYFAPQTRKPTKDFVTNWVEMVKAGGSNSQKRDLILTQEYMVKGIKARIKYNKKDGTKENKEIGLSLLKYRFGTARQIVQDVKEGLSRD